MIRKVNCALNSNDDMIVQQFISRLLLTKIQTKNIKSSDRYTSFEACWDDSDKDLFLKNHNNRNAGAKPKILKYNNTPVTCGLVYQLRCQKNLSDAQIGVLFDISESTICRRRKKHTLDGNFFENSNIIF